MQGLQEAAHVARVAYVRNAEKLPTFTTLGEVVGLGPFCLFPLGGSVDGIQIVVMGVNLLGIWSRLLKFLSLFLFV